MLGGSVPIRTLSLLLIPYLLFPMNSSIALFNTRLGFILHWWVIYMIFSFLHKTIVSSFIQFSSRAAGFADYPICLVIFTSITYCSIIIQFNIISIGLTRSFSIYSTTVNILNASSINPKSLLARSVE